MTAAQIQEDIKARLSDIENMLPASMPRVSEDMIRDSLMSDEFLDFVKINMMPVEQLMTFYQCAIMQVETKFNILNEQFSLSLDRNPIQSIKSRVKSYDSIMKKIRRKKIGLSIEDIEDKMNDIAGVRVICSYVDDIYLLADCLLSQDDVILVERKDYIKNPKPSGYRSLHLIIKVPIYLQNEKKEVKVEVQLRTIAMDFWASLEHSLHYKRCQADGAECGEAEELAGELIECAKESARLDAKMQEIRDRIAELSGES